MRRKPVPNPLSLTNDSDPVGERSAVAANTNAHTYPDPTALETDRPSPRSALANETSLQVISPASSKSPKSPRSPLSKFNTTKKPQAPSDEYQPLQPPDEVHIAQLHQHQSPQRIEPDLPPLTAIPPSNSASNLPNTSSRSGKENEKHSRSGSRFFNFSKGSRSTNQLYHNHTDATSMDEVMSRVPENSVMSDKASSKHSKNSDLSSVDPPNQKSAPSLPSRSDVSLVSTGEQDVNAQRKNKPKPFTLLGRNRSLKDNKDEHSPNEPITIKLSEAEGDGSMMGMQPLRTAPMNSEGYDRSFRHMMNSAARNHSADRALPRETPGNKDNRNDKDYNRSHPSSYKDNNGSTFLTGLKNSGSRAADMISKGLFGRSGRSASTTERDTAVDDEHYVLKVINLPLVEQTRLTRISKRLEDSRDKTEFWMPAFPWRAIDYLNLKGTDVEGLYRVPGSGPQIKKWQRKFDEEYDVDLFAQDDLYDINIIGSMFKAWLRELPDELFPKEAQERISRECAGAQQVPQLLIDELSNLSPFNYYLLFAITCHLSLLLAHSDKNKMDFRNLCICFQPCMKIDAFCFKFLVCDWRMCWQGCKNEAKYIEEEYMLFQQPIPRGLSSDPRNQNGGETQNDRNLSSSDSSKLSVPPVEQSQANKRHHDNDLENEI
ncbi:hypothetical protein AAE478_000631 [Parahypoxylon ruwenzoriense]